jgi:hypothetical protein
MADVRKQLGMISIGVKGALDPRKQAAQMLSQQGGTALLRPLTPAFGHNGLPEWGTLLRRKVVNGGFPRRFRG